MKQYLPMKPIKRGLKVWVLWVYVSRLEVYTGNRSEDGLGANVVRTLRDGLKKK